MGTLMYNIMYNILAKIAVFGCFLRWEQDCRATTIGQKDKKLPETWWFRGADEPQTRLELVTSSLRVKRSTN